MGNFFKKNKLLVFIIGVELLLIIIIGWGIFYFYQRNQIIKENTEKNRVEREENRRKIDQISEFKKYAEEIDLEKNRLDIFVSSEEIVSLIEEIEKIAERTGNVIFIESEDKKKESAVPVSATNEKKQGLMADLLEREFLKFKIKTEGSFNSGLEFLEKLENMPYASEIISFNFLFVPKEKENLSSFSGKKQANIFSETEQASVFQNTKKNSESEGKEKISLETEVLFYLK